MVNLKLDKNFKIIDFQADKTNIRFQILNEQNLDSFLWFNAINVADEKMNEIAETIKILEERQKTPEENQPNLSISTINHNETVLLDENQKLIDDLFLNLKPIEINSSQSNSLKDILEENKFLFILFGAEKKEVNDLVINSWIRFWIKFHMKHKFVIVYIGPDHESNIDFSQVEWFTIENKDLKVCISSVFSNFLSKLILN
jgi:hypothetical protein